VYREVEYKAELGCSAGTFQGTFCGLTGAISMKRIGNLYSQITDYQNLVQAHIKARRGKSYYSDVMKLNADPDKYLKRLQSTLVNKEYKTSKYTTKVVHEPKERLIFKLPYYPDRIVHHAIMNILQPIWDKMFISEIYSAIPGRGIHTGILRLRDFLRDEKGTKYCLKFDISKFYPSVNHEILISLIKRKIKCADTLWLLEEIIRSPGGEKNIPIGNYLSQYFANIYLNGLDHWLKEQCDAKYYIRYGDDGVILSSDRSYLVDLKSQIESYLHDRLALEINPKSRIIHVDSQGIDFLGYRTYRTYSLLRKSNVRRLKRRVNAITAHPEMFGPQHIVSSIVSILGWLSYCNSYNLANKYIYSNIMLQHVFETSVDMLGIDKSNVIKLVRGA
jgi:retron-type reverse transcriptase